MAGSSTYKQSSPFKYWHEIFQSPKSFLPDKAFDEKTGLSHRKAPYVGTHHSKTPLPLILANPSPRLPPNYDTPNHAESTSLSLIHIGPIRRGSRQDSYVRFDFHVNSLLFSQLNREEPGPGQVDDSRNGLRALPFLCTVGPSHKVLDIFI